MNRSQMGNPKSINKLVASTSAIALCLAMTSTEVFAQNASAKASETIVVRGIRKGIQDSISAKKRSSQIVEAVSAEDIGKLPDASIAESIARLPGVAAQRDNGRAQTLSIRGLGPDYTVTTLNGREQASTNNNRSVEFDQYPGELISQVKVFKTPIASMPTQGLAGTADLNTVRPLAFGKRVIQFGYKREKNSKSAIVGGTSNTGDRFTATYINQYFDKTLGVAIGFAKSKSPYQNNRWESWGYTNNFYNTGNSIADGVKPIAASGLVERTGVMGVLEWKPNDQAHVTFDAYHSDFNETTRNQRIEFPLFNPANNGGTVGGNPGWDGSTVLQKYTASNGVVNSATYTGVKAVVGNYVNQRDAKLDSFGLNGTYDLKNGWNLMADVSYSKVNRVDLVVETTAGTGPNGSGALDTITIDQSEQTGAKITNTIDYSNFNNLVLTDPRGWGGGAVAAIGGQTGYVHRPHVIDEIKSLRLEATQDVNNGFIKNFQYGLNHSERSKSLAQTEGYLSIATGAKSAAVPDKYRRGTTDLSFIGMSKGIIAWDAMGLYNDGFYRYTENNFSSALVNSWAVNERVDTFYAMANIDSKLGEIPVTGNIGVQAIQTFQEGNSKYSSNSFNPKSITDQARYSDVLPSMNLTFAMPRDVYVRLAAAQTVVRPRMDQMQVGYWTEYKNNSNPENVQGANYYWKGEGGNINLKPWKANAFDLSFEKYFGRKGYVAAAVFYKDLTTFIYNYSALINFDKNSITASDLSTGQYSLANSNTLGYFSTKKNGNGGTLKGVELSASLPFEVFLPMLDGFGAQASATFNQSKIAPEGIAKDLPGLSKKVINATIFYEKHGFSARVSQRYRDDFLGEVLSYDGKREDTWVHNEKILDAQIGYSFDKGPLNGLSINLSGSNLNDEPFYTYEGKGHPEKVKRYEKYGKTYTLNVSYKF